MKLGVYQCHPEFGDVQGNIKKAVECLNGAEADLIVLPELFNTGYQFVSKVETNDLSEEIPRGYTCKTMIDLARSKKNYIVFGIAEKEGDNLYNSAAVVGPDGYIGTYRKAHLFAEETLFFDPGNTGFQVFDLGMARIGVMICFDWQFPETARILALKGADIICHPSNLVLPFCQRAMVTRSLENGVFSATANRIGTEERGGKKPLTFTGVSQILGTKGEILIQMGEDDTGIKVVEINPVDARDKMITAQNDRIKDRRPDLYGKIVE